MNEQIPTRNLPLEPPVNQRIPASPTQIAEFCQRWKIIEFALFGSVLRDDFRPDSDIIDWRRIIGLRNILIHPYDEIRQQTIWTTVISEF